jgi:hypothetical protein
MLPTPRIIPNQAQPCWLLPLSNAAALLALLLGDALDRRQTLSLSQDASLGALLQNLTWDLSRLVLKMFDHCQEYRSCVTRILLQPLLISLEHVSCVVVQFGVTRILCQPLLKLSWLVGFLSCAVVTCSSSTSPGSCVSLC